MKLLGSSGLEINPKLKTGSGPMTAHAYRETLEALQMNQLGSGRFLETGERTVRRWASNRQEVPAAVAMLLRLMVVLELDPNEVRRLVSLPALSAAELNRGVGNPGRTK